MSSTPSFFRHFARISEPVSSAIGASPSADHAAVLQAADRVATQAEPVAQHFLIMLTQYRRRCHRRWPAVETHWPGRHAERAIPRVLDGLEDAALLEGLVVVEFHRVEHGAGRNTGGADDLHA